MRVGPQNIFFQHQHFAIASPFETDARKRTSRISVPPAPRPSLALAPASLPFFCRPPTSIICPPPQFGLRNDDKVEQHEQLMSEFEGKYTELKNHCFEMQHNFFRAVEEHEDAYFNSVGHLAQVGTRGSSMGDIVSNAEASRS